MTPNTKSRLGEQETPPTDAGSCKQGCLHITPESARGAAVHPCGLGFLPLCLVVPSQQDWFLCNLKSLLLPGSFTRAFLNIIQHKLVFHLNGSSGKPKWRCRAQNIRGASEQRGVLILKIDYWKKRKRGERYSPETISVCSLLFIFQCMRLSGMTINALVSIWWMGYSVLSALLPHEIKSSIFHFVPNV